MPLFTKKEKNTGFPRYKKSERDYNVKLKNETPIKATTRKSRRRMTA